MRVSALVPAVGLLAGTASAAAFLNSTANPTVTIASGVVVGTATSIYGQPTATLKAYLGIPFAVSPPERFSPPSPPQAWSAPIIAQKVAPACVQQFPREIASKRPSIHFLL
jgi:Carboxylesterase family